MKTREIVQALMDSVQKGDFENAKFRLAEDFQSSGPSPEPTLLWVGGVLIQAGMPEKAATNGSQNICRKPVQVQDSGWTVYPKGQMIKINNSTTIYRPIGQVFDFVSTPENDFQWQYGTLESGKLCEGDGKVGTSFQSIGHLMGRRNLSTFEVTEYEPNKKYGFKSLSGPLQSYTSYTFENANGITKINISTQANAANFLQENENRVKKNLQKQQKENLVMLKDILEARRTSPASGTTSSAT